MRCEQVGEREVEGVGAEVANETAVALGACGEGSCAVYTLQFHGVGSNAADGLPADLRGDVVAVAGDRGERPAAG